MIRAFRLAALVALGVLVLATGWVVGYVAYAVALVLLALRLVRTARSLGPTLRCPHCGADVPVHGLFRCGGCGGVSEGIAWRCALCGAGPYTFLSCTRCGVSIPNPAGRAS